MKSNFLHVYYRFLKEEEKYGKVRLKRVSMYDVQTWQRLYVEAWQIEKEKIDNMIIPSFYNIGTPYYNSITSSMDYRELAKWREFLLKKTSLVDTIERILIELMNENYDNEEDKIAFINTIIPKTTKNRTFRYYIEYSIPRSVSVINLIGNKLRKNKDIFRKFCSKIRETEWG